MNKSKTILITAVIALVAVAVLMTNSMKKHAAVPPTAATAAATSVASIASNALLPTIVQSSVQDSADNKVKTITLPYTQKGVKDEVLNFNISLLFKKGQQTKFKVIPDDCVEEFTVNTHSVMPTGALPPEYCNWKTGFMIDLQTYLKEGNNDIYIVIRNKQGPTGLKFLPVSQ